MPTTRIDRVLSIAVLTLFLSVASAMGTRSATAEPPTTHGIPRVCFPRDAWDGQDSLRPCARIVRLYEDGSFKVRVSDANGTVRYSLGVGNPQD